tara:strand:- start:714 stop:1541 length:828 start_codon:yes stop_codon:yes gene_type:complete
MNNNNLYKRPMFRKGGSAAGGITSGLQSRPGYNVAGRVTDVMGEMRSVIPQRNTPQRRFNDFLIDFGLDIATRSPMGSGIGGAISTALASAKDPFDRFKQSRAAGEAFDDKLALGAYDIVKAEQLADKQRQEKLEDMKIQDDYKRGQIKLESELNPKLKKVFREEIPEVRINNYAASLQESDFDFIANNSMEIAEDIVTFNVFKEKNPDSGPAKKNFRGILPYEYDKKGKPVPNYESIAVGQVFYNPEDGLFYERIAEEGIIGTDFKALDPFTYE